MFHRRRTRFKFTEKKHSRKGILSLGAALLLLGFFVLFVFISSESNGGLSAYFGSAGVFLMLLSATTLVFAFQSLFEEDSFQIFPRMAFGVSLICCVCWIGTFLVGLGLIQVF